MGKFRLTQLALADLRSIGRYTQLTWGREQRTRYLEKLDNGFHVLAEQPQRGGPEVLGTARSGGRTATFDVTAGRFQDRMQGTDRAAKKNASGAARSHG